MTVDSPTLPEHVADPGPTSPRALGDPPWVEERRSRWPGWVWAIPIAALGVVGWLIYDQLASGGPAGHDRISPLRRRQCGHHGAI